MMTSGGRTVPLVTPVAVAFGFPLATLVLGCGDNGRLERLAEMEEPRQAIEADDRTQLGFSILDIPNLASEVRSVLSWRGDSSGFQGLPSNGETAVRAVLSYDGGFVEAVGDPVWQLEAQLRLRMSTLDGSLDENVECLLRATSLDGWICSAQPTALTGAFEVTARPPGDLRYDVWVSARAGVFMGGVGALVTTEEQLSALEWTGTFTGYTAGVWVEDPNAGVK